MTRHPIPCRLHRIPSRLRRRMVAPIVLAGLGALALAACGSARSQPVAVATPTTVASPPIAAAPPSTTATPPATEAAAAAVCAPADLSADQLPVSSGTGSSYLAWSLTDTGTSSCLLPAGQPTLAFLDAAGSIISSYTVSHLATAADTSVTIAPGKSAWFLTEETTTACGTGTVVDGGPFHYVIGLPGAAGSVSWTAGYLSGSTLSDYCGSVSLSVGDLQATEPTAP
jgi:hypothetical protein